MTCLCCGQLSHHPQSSRRTFLALGAAALAAPSIGAWPALAAEKKTSLTPDRALAILKEGNENYMTDSPVRAVQGRERRLEIARGQTPFATLVSCSDSRVPPELLFGRGLGELFIIRNAGNTVDTTALGSIEYGVAELGVPLIVVMGHEACGAVSAALSVVENNTRFPGSLGQMIEPIIPAVLQAKSTLGSGDRAAFLDAAVRENARRVAARLLVSGPIIGDAVRAGKLKIVAARYDFNDGKVDFFE